MKKAIKIFTLLLALALVISTFAIAVFATDDCETTERNVAGEATLSGNSLRWCESYFRQYINDGDRLTGSPVNKVDNADDYDTVFTFATPYKFTKIVIQTYGVGRIEEDYTISSWVSGKTSEYDIDVYLYNEAGSEIFHTTVTAGGTDDIVIELDESIGYACSAGVFYERNGQSQCIWEFELYTKDNHNWEDLEVTTPATCTTAGLKTIKCDCGEEIEALIPATGHKNSCTGVCANDNCEEAVTVEHVQEPGSTDCASCEATDVFEECAHVEDALNPCTGICAICKQPDTVTIQHISDGSTCNDDCVKCGAENVIPTAYDLASQGKNPFATSTNTPLSENMYITHMANPDDPCDTTCNNPDCDKKDTEGVVTALHVGTACGQTECTECTKPFYAYKNNTYHVRRAETDSTNACSASCASCNAYRPLYWGHTYEDCTSNCIYCDAFTPSATERRHTFTVESPYTCIVDGCGYTNPSLKLCVDGHTYTNRCDQKCDVCGVQGAKSFFGGSNQVPEYWHCYQNSCDTTCEDCGDVREITHTYPEACATKCTVCGILRETTVPHTYSNVLDAELNPIANSSACDTVCDACNEVREVPHYFVAKCSKKCLICGISNANIVHTYDDNSCDTDCNIIGCDGTREAVHVWTNACDTECDNNCGVTRTVEHVYTTACDTTCNRGCGFIRTNAQPHKYDNGCDATCNNSGCDYVRTAQTDANYFANHSYANACDAECDSCGVTRTPFDHAYDNACDADCNVCGATRAPADHVYGDEFDKTEDGYKEYTCTVCGYKNKSDEKAGLSGGAIAGIVIGSVAVAGGGGFSLWWFVFKKKRV